MNCIGTEKIKLTYNFKNNLPGDADGEITAELLNCQKDTGGKVAVFWTAKGEMLEDYTPLFSFDANEEKKSFVIDKDLKIPCGADGLGASLELDGNTYFSLTELPKEKLTKPYGEKICTIALTSDYHFGGWGSKLAPKKGIAKGIEDMNRYADAVLANGDLVQWHAAYSEEEFVSYNWNGVKYGDNGETSPEFLKTGYSQWQVLTDAFKTLNIPVYVTSGGHDVPDNPGWSKMCCTDKYWNDFFDSWVKYSEDKGLYPQKIKRNPSATYFDIFFFGYHIVATQIPRSVHPFGAFGDDQLEWLDKTLFDGEESGKPIFVFGHNPINMDFAGRHGLDETKDACRFVEILQKHPTAVYISGHSHHTLDSTRRNSVDGKQTEPSFVHDGGMTSITYPPTYAQMEGTHLVFAEIYNDVVLLRGRDALNGKWISMGLTELTLKKKCTVELPSVKKEEKDGKVVVSVQNPDKNLKYTWFFTDKSVEGESVTIEKTYSGFVALRAEDDEGNYKSVTL